MCYLVFLSKFMGFGIFIISCIFKTITFIIAFNSTKLYLYIYVSLPTVVEGDQKAPFSIAIAFPRLLHLPLVRTL